MRQIRTHRFNGINKKLKIFALDEPSNGFNYEYGICLEGREICLLKFGTNQLTHEALIAILVDRMEQTRLVFPTHENEKILHHLKRSLKWAGIRISRRFQESQNKNER